MIELPLPKPCHPFLRPGAGRVSVGLRPVAEPDWLWIDSDYAGQIALKDRLLNERHDEVFAALPETGAASRETLELILAWLASHASGWFELHDGMVTDRITARRLVCDGLHPLEMAGRLVQEDLCIMRPTPDGHMLVAASLCFPSRWRLRDKIGRVMRDIHTPVAHFDRIAAASDQRMSVIAAGGILERANWGVHDTAELFQPMSPAHAATVTRGNAGEQLFVRLERQTLRRLPGGDLLFTIKTLITRLDALSPDVRAGLSRAVREMSPETLAYKGMRHIAEILGDSSGD